MNAITAAQARRDIIDLRLPAIVLDIFDELPLPYRLDVMFRAPSELFALDRTRQARYGQGRITPIWSDNAYTILAFHHDPSRRGYFRFDIESGAEEAPLALSWQQVLVKEFRRLWQAELSDEWLRECARLFAFDYFDDMILELARVTLDTPEKAVRWERAFLARIS